MRETYFVFRCSFGFFRATGIILIHLISTSVMKEGFIILLDSQASIGDNRTADAACNLDRDASWPEVLPSQTQCGIWRTIYWMNPPRTAFGSKYRLEMGGRELIRTLVWYTICAAGWTTTVAGVGEEDGDGEGRAFEEGVGEGVRCLKLSRCF